MVNIQVILVTLAYVTGVGLPFKFLQAFPQLGQNVTTPVEFTPQSPGKLTWTCSMGMYYGVIEVI